MVLLICLMFSAHAKEPSTEEKNQKIADLRARIESKRDELQRQITQRWKAKEDYIKKRETNKHFLTQLLEKQERLFMELSRIKEENFIKERKISEGKTELNNKKEAWSFVLASLDDILDKESEKVGDFHILDREARQLGLEKVRREYGKKKNIIASIKKYVDYKQSLIDNGNSLSISKQVILADDGSTQTVQFARFGNVFGYGVNDKSELFYLHQTGMLGANRYKVEPILDPLAKQSIQTALSGWVSAQSISGSVLVDVMQNDQSEALISGKKVSAEDKFKDYIRSGGAIMIPLLLLPVWALILILLKLFTYASQHWTGVNVGKKVVKLLEANKESEALALVQKKKRNSVSKVIASILEHKKYDRDTSEKAVKEVIIKEVPVVNKHLMTLAVIAAVAPLMGLLGTVSGMISLFEVINQYGSGDPKLMAGGISEALVTTLTGLSIAIPILLIHNFLRNIGTTIKSDMEKAAIQVLNIIWINKNKSAAG